MTPVTRLSAYRLGDEQSASPAELDAPDARHTLRLVRPLLSVPRSEIEAYCQEQGLEPRFDRSNEDVTFYRANRGFTFDGTNHLLLSVDAPPLSSGDRGHPLLLLDSTWRWLPKIL